MCNQGEVDLEVVEREHDGVAVLEVTLVEGDDAVVVTAAGLV